MVHEAEWIDRLRASKAWAWIIPFAFGGAMSCMHAVYV